MSRPPLFRQALAEFIGTYALVTAGCGAIIVNAQTNAVTHVGVALTFGLIITVMIASVGHISGAHFNPSVTVAFALIRRLPWRVVPVYVLAQLGGSVLGALTLYGLFGKVAMLGATVPAGTDWQALGLEILLTGVLMFVITSVATDAQAAGHLAALAIGATVALEALWGGPISGASMNPARSLGPALVAGAWQSHWVYWVGPLLGAALGAWAYQLIRQPPGDKSPG